METNDATWVQPVVAGILDVSAGRFGAIIAAVAGLIGVVLGVRALVRAGRASSGRTVEVGTRPGEASVALGLVGLLLGGLVTATSDGGLGTGNGLGGAFVAMALGLTSAVLGGLARVRARQAA